MTAAVVALATTCVFLSLTLLTLVWMHATERTEWGEERRQLVDRIIARHTGEVIALDRSGSSHAPQPQPPVERPVPVGL